MQNSTDQQDFYNESSSTRQMNPALQPQFPTNVAIPTPSGATIPTPGATAGFGVPGGANPYAAPYTAPYGGTAGMMPYGGGTPGVGGVPGATPYMGATPMMPGMGYPYGGTTPTVPGGLPYPGGAGMPGVAPAVPGVTPFVGYPGAYPTNVEATPGAILPLEQSYIENILRLNLGRKARVFMTYEYNTEWPAMVYTGIIDEAGRDHIIIRDEEKGKSYLLLMVNLDWVEIEGQFDYIDPTLPTLPAIPPR